MLSETALSLLRSYRGDIMTDESNGDGCREQGSAGMLVVGHSFSRGRERFYRLTEASVRAVSVLGRVIVPSPFRRPTSNPYPVARSRDRARSGGDSVCPYRTFTGPPAWMFGLSTTWT